MLHRVGLNLEPAAALHALAHRLADELPDVHRLVSDEPADQPRLSGEGVVAVVVDRDDAARLGCVALRRDLDAAAVAIRVRVVGRFQAQVRDRVM